jgi:hypothetical protein
VNTTLLLHKFAIISVLVIIVFGAHVFTELLFADVLPVSFPGAPALYPDEEYPDAKGNSEVWKGVPFMESAEHGSGGNQAGKNKEESGFHN